MYQSVKKSMKTRNPAQQVRICIWELVAHWGLHVETIREDVTLGGEWRSRDWWDGVIADMVSGSTEQQQLVNLKEKVLGWAETEEPMQQGAQRYVVNWCAGWAEKTREIWEELGTQMIAVDTELERMGVHHLNVQMDIMETGPGFLKSELARILKLKTKQLCWDWAGIPCTTRARSDSSNKRMRDGTMKYGNYRINSGVERGEPQHPKGSEKGSKVREHDNMLRRMLMVFRRDSLGWAVENPRAIVQDLKIMKDFADDMVPVDYCMEWDQEERREGYLWQKPTVLYTRRQAGGHWKRRLCENRCQCARWIKTGNGKRIWKHRGSLESLTEMSARLSKSKEALKCTYPEKMVRDWLQWVQE
jgi:hypothetical protein